MSNLTSKTIGRRGFLQGSIAAAGAIAGLSAATAARAAGTRNTDTVRLGWGRGGLPLIAKQRGLFEKSLAAKNIKVEWVGPFPNHAPSLQAVVGGSSDFGFWGSSTPAFAAIIAGSPLVFTQFSLYNPRTTAIIAKNGSGIDKIEDLVGKSVAVNRSGLGEFLLVAALEKHGVDRSKVNFVYLNPPDAAPAFGQGKVDAWSMWSPGVDIARTQFDAHDIFFEGKDLEFAIDYNSLLTTRTFATDNSELVRAVIDAYREEANWVNDNPAEAEVIAQAEGKYADTIRDTLAGYKRKFTYYEVDDPEFLKQIQFAADWLSERKILPQPITVKDHVVKV